MIWFFNSLGIIR